jgi:hypothetical protein
MPVNYSLRCRSGKSTPPEATKNAQGAGMFAKAFLRRDSGNPLEVQREPQLAAQPAAGPIPFRGTNRLAPQAPSPGNAAQHALWEKAEKVLEAQRKWLAGVNSALPNGLSIITVPLIPTGVWWREQGDFLMHGFEFFPASLANTILAANDPITARTLNLPLAPRVQNKLLEDSTHQRLCQLRQRFATEHENMGLAFARGDFTSLASSQGRKARYARELVDIACSIGMATFGKQAWLTHERYFYSVLGPRKI